jgi:hypothetical protein
MHRQAVILFFLICLTHSLTIHLFIYIFIQMWYPCGSFKGDERSAALAKSYADGGLLSNLSKSQLDAGISGSLYRDQAKLIEGLVRALPHLRPDRNNLEFGYELAFEGLDESKSKLQLIEIKEQKNIFDNIKNAFNFGGN